MMNTDKFIIESLFALLDVTDKETLKIISNKIGIPTAKLKYYNDNLIIPYGDDLEKISRYTSLSKEEIEMKLGYFSPEVKKWIRKNADYVLSKIKLNDQKKEEIESIYNTSFGDLYHDDCLKVLKNIADETVDMVFADPPFNLDKDYGKNINDNMSKSKYIEWCEKWVKECIRVLKPGGTMFIYNLPYWNTYISNIMNQHLSFRHWIAISMKGLIPVHGKLHPEHYGLLYYTKGDKPNTFNKQRIPLSTCRHCGGEIRDYGGKKSELSQEGISVSDIFTDINPVRHKKYKNRSSNELPLRLLYRLISLSTNEGDLVLDPFGGAGTTYIVSEYLRRRWIGMEIGDVKVIIDRLDNFERDKNFLEQIEKESNVLFTEEQVKLRKQNGFWTYEKLKKS